MFDHRPRTVVVTGASGGIGRATALAFADEGDVVVLVARRSQALEELAEECRRRGAPDAMVAAVDVAEPGALENVARRVAGRFGRIDVWVNNAAVMHYGRTEETAARHWRRVVEVNLFGTYHGARAALPWMREQGSGVLVNVSSILGRAASPYQSAYVASKHAVRALSDSIRQELDDAPGIAVCTVLPGSTDTPLFRAAANWTGRTVVPPAPPMDPRRVAAAIVLCSRRPRRQAVVGLSTRLGLLASRIAPALTERVLGRWMHDVQFTDDPAPRTDGNLFEPSDEPARVDGGWRDEQELRRVGRAALVGFGAATAAAAVLAVRVARRWDET